MSERDEDEQEEMSLERARQIILSRRARFVAAALAGVQGAGCEVTRVCLSFSPPDVDAGNSHTADGGPSVCLGMAYDGGTRECLTFDAGPQVCLSPPWEPCLDDYLDAGAPRDAGPTDAGPDASVDGGADAGAKEPCPRVCLTLSVRFVPEDDEP